MRPLPPLAHEATQSRQREYQSIRPSQRSVFCLIDVSTRGLRSLMRLSWRSSLKVTLVPSENSILLDARHEPESSHHPGGCLRSCKCSGSSLSTFSSRDAGHRSGFKAFWRWKSRTRAGRPKVDRQLTDEQRESALGCAPDPWRIADAGVRSRPVDGPQYLVRGRRRGIL